MELYRPAKSQIDAGDTVSAIFTGMLRECLETPSRNALPTRNDIITSVGSRHGTFSVLTNCLTFRVLTATLPFVIFYL